MTGASVTDTLPAAATSASWTAVASAGASDTTASGTGNIADTVSLASGATVTYTVAGTIDPAASGTLTNTATITAPVGATDPNTANNNATDSDTLDPGPIAVEDRYFILKVDPIRGDISCRSGCVLNDTVATNDTPSPVGGNVWSIVPGDGPDPNVGTVVMNPDGSFTYTTFSDGLNSDSFTYQIEDADGLVSTATVGIEIDGAK